MTPSRHRALVALVLATSFLAVACTDLSPSTTASIPNPTATPVASSGPASNGPTVAPVASGPLALDDLSITTESFARILNSPLSMIAPDDGTGRIFVANQVGQVWLVSRDGKVAKDLVVNLDDRILSGGEQGLLGIATHPGFASDPRVFVDFTNNEGDSVVASLTIDPANPDRLDPSTFKRLLFVDQPYPNHNGGSIEFGLDGYLYIAFGDGGSGGDPHGNGQNPNALLGKILRIDVDKGDANHAYAIPSDNPFATTGGKPEIWLLGMRNPWRISFDRENGDLWIGDVGQGLWEEVDVVRAGSPGGLNFGWNITEGAHCYNATKCNEAGLTKPVAEYGHDLGCAITGGYVYRGSRYPFLVGTYLFSDNCSGRIFAIDAGSDGPSMPVEVGQGGGSVAGFGEGADGELYILTLEGSVNHLVAARR
jgi:glucose/arabinose dehydrogenase